MSATNSTPTINLPLFIGTDKPAWLVDWNGAMNAIDSAIAALQTAESGTAASLAALSNSVTALSNTVSQQTTAIETVTQSVNQLAGNVTTINGNINTINSLIGNGEPTTTDKTIIGAINEINAKLPEGGAVEADDVSFDNTGSDLVATNVQAAIVEVNGKIPTISTPDAEDVSYDNTTSGLTATNVQAAIDELAEVSIDDDFGTAVDLSSYTGTSNFYTFPSDGYLGLYNAKASMYGSTAANKVNVSTATDIFAVFVRKGMRLNDVVLQTAGVVTFTPFA